MKINSISNFTANCTPLKPKSFGHTAVPYPEYQYAYIHSQQNPNIFSVISSKISDIFHPEVSKQADNIKHQIDTIFDNRNQTGKYINALA